MYRAVALAFHRAGASPTAEGAAQVLPSLDLDVQYQDHDMRVLLGVEDVTTHLRTAAVGALVSPVATLQPVRSRMVKEQRRIGREQEDIHGGVVLDGRDTGTVVFPEAEVKIYMVADLKERARRRQQEYEARGESISLADVEDEIRDRDRRDRTRDIAPLRQAEDAIVYDTTDESIEDQVQFVVDRVKDLDGEGT
jgi:cytidylate kinase